MKNIEFAAPTVMSVAGRAAEIASILAVAIIRTQIAENEVHSAPYLFGNLAQAHAVLPQ